MSIFRRRPPRALMLAAFVAQPLFALSVGADGSGDVHAGACPPYSGWSFYPRVGKCFKLFSPFGISSSSPAQTESEAEPHQQAGNLPPVRDWDWVQCQREQAAEEAA